MKRLISSWVIGLLALGALLLVTGGSRATQAAPAQPAAGCSPEWSLVPGPSNLIGGGPSGVAALAANDVWIVGLAPATSKQGLIMHWDGSAWDMVNAPGNIAYDLISIDAAAPDDIWAVGYTQDGPPAQPVAIHWDGKSWQWVPVAPAAGLMDMRLYRVTARSADDAWAVGEYNTMVQPQRMIMHWNGMQWSTAYLGGAVPGGRLTDVTAIAADDAWAIGTPDANGNRVLHWDGQQWTPVAVPFAGTFNGITANAANDVWLVGNDSSTLIVHWDGTSWTRTPSPTAPGSALWNIRFAAANDGWATGVYQDSTAWGMLLLHWDGASWTLSPTVATTSGRMQLYGLAAVQPGEAWTVAWATGWYPAPLIARWMAPCLSSASGAAPPN